MKTKCEFCKSETKHYFDCQIIKFEKYKKLKPYNSITQVAEGFQKLVNSYLVRLPECKCDCRYCQSCENKPNR